MDLNYLKLLAEQFPNKAAAATEIVNLQTVLRMPKGTEHFLSDIHGEHEAFIHVMKNCSGVVRRIVGEIFSGGGIELSETQQCELASLVYYPKERLELLLSPLPEQDHFKWLFDHLEWLVVLLIRVSSKFTRKKVRKAMNPQYVFVIEELISAYTRANDEVRVYFESVVTSIVETGCAKVIIVSVCEMIQRLAIDRLHIVGDIYDRGSGADIIMDILSAHPSVDVQWGNHDVLWMAAAMGCETAISTAVRISLRYTNMRTLEDGYGIGLLPLATFALEVYGQDPCSRFKTMRSGERELTNFDIDVLNKMHKAISVIQFKLEGQLVERRPEFGMGNRILLPHLNVKDKTVKVEGKTYPLLDYNFPTFDSNSPHSLTEKEVAVIRHLKAQFLGSQKLQKHVAFLFNHGSMYKVFNGTLMLHGSVPCNKDGTFKKFSVGGKGELSGKEYIDYLEDTARGGANLPIGHPERELSNDMMYYLWTGPDSPLFGKAKMTTFERYFIANKETHKEPRDPYYNLRLLEDTANMILKEFGCPPHGKIINGHTPVKVGKGESPVKANGKLIIIDGGFSHAYQKETGIGGFTLIHNSYGYLIAQHKPFKGTRAAIQDLADNHAKTFVVEAAQQRIMIASTDLGKELSHRVDDLKALIEAFSKGHIKERKITLFARL